MKIDLLKVDNLRVIDQLSFSPNKRLNVVIGDNGAGKTTVLEAIYLAGRGRSFRHSESKPLIKQGAEEAVVVANLLDEISGKKSTLGLARGPKTVRCRLDGEDVRRRSQLAQVLPVQWIGSQPQIFLEYGPDARRRFVDMAVFHVEPDYLMQIAEYQRILKQRNAALRSGGRHDVKIWNKSLAVLGEAIDAARRRAIATIFNGVDETLRGWDLGFSVTHRYQPGWNTENTLESELQARTRYDEERGFTSRGPHRAELEIRSAEGPAAKILSRGQQKMLVIALHLAAIDTIKAAVPTGLPVLLVDDLAAELDLGNRNRVIDAICARDCQAFITRLTDDRLPEPAGCSTWNMKRGQLV